MAAGLMMTCTNLRHTCGRAPLIASAIGKQATVKDLHHQKKQSRRGKGSSEQRTPPTNKALKRPSPRFQGQPKGKLSKLPILTRNLKSDPNKHEYWQSWSGSETAQRSWPECIFNNKPDFTLKKLEGARGYRQSYWSSERVKQALRGFPDPWNTELVLLLSAHSAPVFWGNWDPLTNSTPR